MKTERVEWLLAHIGELEGEDLKEAEMIKEWYTISDDEPTAYDKRSDKSGLDDGVPIPRNARTLGDVKLDPGTHVNVVFGGEAPVERGSRLEGVAALEERINMMEATVRDLYVKIKALENRLDVGKPSD